MARRSTDSVDDEPAKKGGSGMLLLLGGCGGVLLLCLVCGGGGVGIWWWKKPAIDAVVEDVKAKNPVKGTAPLGKVSRDELDPEAPFWDFTIRLPKGLTITVKDKATGADGEALYQWTQMGAQGSWIQINVTKVKLAGGPTEPVGWFFMGVTKFKSDPGDKVQFDTIHMPQPVELNGLTGARSWTLFTHAADNFQVMVRYRYHIDGWGYVFQCPASGRTEQDARQRAELLDVSICTFKKR